MSETYEADVVEVLYVGPHSVLRDIYAIEVKVQPAPGASWGFVTLRFPRAAATFLAHMLQSNPPIPPATDERLLDQIAALGT